MDTIALTTTDCETSSSHMLSYKLENSMQLKNNYVCMSSLSLFYTWKNIKASYGNNSLKYHVKDKLVDVIFPDASYTIDDINNYMHMVMIANNDATEDHFPVDIYPNFNLNRVSIVVKPDCGLVLGEGMAKVLGFSDPTIKTTSHGDLVPKLERVRVVLVHCSLTQNNHAQSSSLIYSFVPRGTFGTELSQEPNHLKWKPTRTTSDVREIDVWFTDQQYRPLEIEDDIYVEIQIAPENFASNYKI